MEFNDRRNSGREYGSGLPKELGGLGGKQHRIAAGDTPTMRKLGLGGYRGTGAQSNMTSGVSNLAKNIKRLKGK
jgi:hypothetical protein